MKNLFSRIQGGVVDCLKKHSLEERVNDSGRNWRTFQHCRGLLGKRHLSILDKARFLSKLLLRPNSAKRALSYSDSSKVAGARRYAIVSFSDMHGNLGQQLQWGDFWIKLELTAAITSLGGVVVEHFMNPDVVIHLFGGFHDLPKADKHVLWIHSHPEKLNYRLLKSYSAVYCISKKECSRISAAGIQCEWLPMATGKRKPRHVGPIDEGVVFVGNALPHLKGSRPVVNDMMAVIAEHPNIKFSLWGGLYEGLPPGIFQGEYIHYHDLDSLYAHSAIVLNDHRPEMRERQFINPRILDVIGSGGFVVSDKNLAIDEMFGDAVPQFENSAALYSLVERYLHNPKLRQDTMAPAFAIIKEFTWERVARALMGV